MADGVKAHLKRLNLVMSTKFQGYWKTKILSFEYKVSISSIMDYRYQVLHCLDECLKIVCMPQQKQGQKNTNTSSESMKRQRLPGLLSCCYFKRCQSN